MTLSHILLGAALRLLSPVSPAASLWRIAGLSLGLADAMHNGLSQAEESAKFVSDRLSVEVVGAGPDVILLPGFACSREVWRPLVPHLAASHRVHLIQPAGFAGAPWTHGGGDYLQPLVKELHRYIDQSHLQSPAIIGHSMGGLVAMLLAQQHPASVARIMTVDSLPFFGEVLGDKMTPQAAQSQGQQVALLLLISSQKAFRSQQAANGPRMTNDPAMRDVITDWAPSSDRKALASAIVGILSTDLRPSLEEIQSPVWALYAADASGGNPPAYADALWKRQYAQLAQVKLVRVDESRHFIMVDQPDKFRAIVADFLDQR